MKWVRIVSIILFALSAAAVVTAAGVQLKNGDTQAPVISAEHDVIKVSVKASEEKILSGITAYDDKDGDVTDSLMIESLSNFIDDDERELSVAAFDEYGNVGKATYILMYTDYTPPKFSLSDPLRFATGISTQKVAQNLTAEDCLDGDVTDLIVMSNAEGSEFDPESEGVYELTFSVANSAGDVEKFTASVEIYDTTSESGSPKVKLTSYLVYIPRGGEYEPLDYCDTLTVNGRKYTWDGANFVTSSGDRLNADFEIDNNVDTNVPGWYETTFLLKSNTSDATVTIRQLVCVEEE